MARRQLAVQAADVQHDVAFALDQAEPLLASLRTLADPDAPFEVIALRMRDLQLGRPGIANLSIAFPSGVMRGTFIDPSSGELRVQQSVVGDRARRARTEPRRRARTSSAARTRTTIRARGRIAARGRGQDARVDAAVHVLHSHATGITVAEPMYDSDGGICAVTRSTSTSASCRRSSRGPPLDDARTIVFARDGTILAYPAAQLPAIAMRENACCATGLRRSGARGAVRARSAAQPTTRSAISISQQPTASISRRSRRSAASAPASRRRSTGISRRSCPSACCSARRTGSRSRARSRRSARWRSPLGVALVVRVEPGAHAARRSRASRAEARSRRSACDRARQLPAGRASSAPAGWARSGAPSTGCSRARPRSSWSAPRRYAIRRTRAEIRERFRREAQTLATMRSQHTIALYDYGSTDEGMFFYVMELLDGSTSTSSLRAHGPQPAARVIQLHRPGVPVARRSARCRACSTATSSRPNLFVCRAADEVDMLKAARLRHRPRETKAIRAAGDRPAVARSAAHVGGPAHAVGALRRHAGLHRARAGVRRCDRRARRSLRARLRGVVAARRRRSVPARQRRRGDPHARAGTGARAAPARDAAGCRPSSRSSCSRCLAKDPTKRPHDARVLAEELRAIVIPDEHAWTPAQGDRVVAEPAHASDRSARGRDRGGATSHARGVAGGSRDRRRAAETGRRVKDPRRLGTRRVLRHRVEGIAHDAARRGARSPPGSARSTRRTSASTTTRQRVGRGARAGVPRDELFLQTKFTHVAGQDDRLPYDPDAPVEAQVAQSYASSLEHLETDRIDACCCTGRRNASGSRRGRRGVARHRGARRSRAAVGASNVDRRASRGARARSRACRRRSCRTAATRRAAGTATSVPRARAMASRTRASRCSPRTATSCNTIATCVRSPHATGSRPRSWCSRLRGSSGSSC